MSEHDDIIKGFRDMESLLLDAFDQFSESSGKILSFPAGPFEMTIDQIGSMDDVQSLLNLIRSERETRNATVELATGYAALFTKSMVGVGDLLSTCIRLTEIIKKLREDDEPNWGADHD